MAIGMPGSNGASPVAVARAGLADDRVVPFGEVHARTSDTVVIRHTLEPRSVPWLEDHSIGREVSIRDPQLRALSVVPMAMSLELMAEAARLLAPASVVTRLSDVRARRWLAFDNEQRTIEVRARLGSDPQLAIGDARLLDEPDDSDQISVVAEIELAATYPEGRPASLAPGQMPSTLDPERYYQEALYHDRTWQALRSRARIDERRASALIELPSPEFAGHRVESLGLHPLLLDAVGQLLGLWSAQVLAEGMFHFPIGIREVTLFGPPPVGGSPVQIALEVSAVEPDLLVADAELSAAGRLHARLAGFASRRFYLPDRLRPLAVPTAVGNLCRSRAGVELGLGENTAVAVTLDVGELRDEAFLGRVWGTRILTRDERRRYRQAGHADSLPVLTLAGLHAAKEAARRLLADHIGIDVRLADIEIEGAGPQYRAAGAQPVEAERGDSPDWPAVHVWLAQKGDRSSALASLQATRVDVLPALERLDEPGSPAPAERPDPDEVLDRLRKTIERLAGDWEIDQPITPESRLIGELAMKSIDLVVIASAMVNAYGLIPFDELYAQMASIPAHERDLTVAQLVDFVCARAPGDAARTDAQD